MRLTVAKRAGYVLALLSVSFAVVAQPFEGPPIFPSPAVTARAAAITASAAPVKAALVQIVDDDAHAAYKEGILSNCTFAGVCTAGFSTVAAGHRRVVEHLSCSVYVPAPGTLRYVAFLANSFSLPRDFAPYSRSAADPAQYFVNIPTLFPFEAGETPLMYAFADSGPIQELFCTATGREILVP